MNLTLVIITARKACCLDWIGDSLRRQLATGERPQVVVVDYWSQEMPDENWTSADVHQRRTELVQQIGDGFDLVLTPPKPTVWQGPHRITKDNWWAIANSRNTGVCLAHRDFIAFCDDRLVLSDHWLQSVRLAAKGPYAVAGAYEKRWNMTVVKGRIVMNGQASPEVKGVDHRIRDCGSREAVRCRGAWLYGGTFALPLEWVLAVNGVEELMDSLSFEDTIFGLVLENNGRLIKYDPRMKIIEDRTPGLATYGKPFRREDKGPIGTEGDKSHDSLRRFGTQKRAQHPWDIREIRETVLKGGPWPSLDVFPKTDWFDGQPITEL